MIKLINESLFRQKTESREKRDGEGKYFLTTFKSAVKTPNPNLKGGLSARNIVSVMHTEEGNFNQQNTKVDAFLGKGSNTMLRLSQGDNQYDTTVYLLAIPYSGIMVPIPEAKELRIYRGVTVRAAKRTIEFQDKKYNKIAFLVLVINPNVFNEKSKYYKDHLDFSVETFNLEDTGDGDEKKTVKTTVTVTFYPDKDPEYASESQEVEAIDPDMYKGQKVFPLYTINPDDKKESKDKGESEKPVNTKKPDAESKKDDEGDDNSTVEDTSDEKKDSSIGTPVIPKNKTLDDMLEEARKAEKENRRAYDNRMNGKKKKKRKRR